MKVLVLGGGVIGVTSAYYLNQAGHEVTVVDRQIETGMETSFANGGQVSWGAGSPWAAPGIPLQALKWLFRRHSPLVLRPSLDPALWKWLFQMLANCTRQRYILNRAQMLRLSRYSHECLVALREETGIHYGEHFGGVLELFRTARELDAAGRDLGQLHRWGVDCRIVDRTGCFAIEPALRASHEKVAGGMHFPADETGDCHIFTQSLAQFIKKRGVTFSLGTNVLQLQVDGGRVSCALTDKGEMKADAYVLACGSYSPTLLRPLGVRLPIYPVKGYSTTVSLRDPNAAPRGSVTDATYKVVITRLGDKLRGAGTAELAGYELSLRSSRLNTISTVMCDLFPGAGEFSQSQSWCGLRPMTPDNLPLLGKLQFNNILINSGHGTLGWTMACGSGKIISDLISSRPTDIDLKDLTLARFS